MSSIIEGIAKNPLVKNVLFGQLKKVFHDGNVDFMVVRIDDKGEIAVDIYEKGEALIVPSTGIDNEPKKRTVKTGK